MNIHKTRLFAKCVTAIFVTFIMLCCIGCHKKESSRKAENPVKITATFYPLYIMLLNITDGISDVTVDVMAPVVTGCLHDYQFTVSDMKKLDESSIIVCNGAGMESFMEKYLENTDCRVVVATDGLALLENEYHHEDEHHHEDEDEHHHEHGDRNPHVWVSVKGAIGEVRNITTALSSLDASHASQYVANAERYIAQLELLDAEMQTALAPYQGTKIITFHEAFPYFAHDFGLVIAAVIEEEADTEPSARELLEIISIVKENNINGLFAEPQYSATSAEIISKETGVPVSLLDPCVTGPLVKDSYINAMKHNQEILTSVLKEK